MSQGRQEHCAQGEGEAARGYDHIYGPTARKESVRGVALRQEDRFVERRIEACGHEPCAPQRQEHVKEHGSDVDSAAFVQA